MIRRASARARQGNRVVRDTIGEQGVTDEDEMEKSVLRLSMNNTAYKGQDGRV